MSFPLERITVNPKIFGGKPIIRGRRLAVEHILPPFSFYLSNWRSAKNENSDPGSPLFLAFQPVRLYPLSFQIENLIFKMRPLSFLLSPFTFSLSPSCVG